jgi:putative PIN family toxin of toxin-antitoxin system
MGKLQVVLDTNVLVSALRSRRGASFRLLELLDEGKFGIDLSVPLVLEYEQEAADLVGKRSLSRSDVEAILDYLCAVARRWKVFYLWRPFLRHPKDDMILELAVAASCDAIVTHNTKDFAGAEQFGVRILRPSEFLRELGEAR